MRIKKIRIKQFGKLSEVELSFSDGCNYMYRENGWGKTTLSVFIRAMFYGFPSRGERAKDREKYRPWGSGIYGGSLTFTVEDHSYTIYRIFGKSKTGSEDEFHLMDEETRKESFRWSSRIGEEVFGINEDSFSNSAWIRQDACSVSSDIALKLGGQANLLNDVKGFDQILTSLEKRLNHLSPGRKTGLIYRKRLEKQELEGEVKNIPALDEEIRRMDARRDQKTEEKRQLSIQHRSLQQKQDDFMVWQEYLHIKEMHDTLQKEYLHRDEIWEKYQEKFPEGLPGQMLLEQWEERKVTESNLRKSQAVLLAGLILVLLSFLLGFPEEVLGKAGFTGGILLLMISFWNLFQLHASVSTSQMGDRNILDQKQLQEILLKQREAEAAETAWKELQKADHALREFYQNNPDFEEMSKSNLSESLKEISSMSELKDKICELEEKMQVITNDIRELEWKTEGVLEERENLFRKEEQLDVLSEELKALDREYWLVETTARFLSEAKESFTAKFMVSIQSAFSNYYRMIDPEQKESLYIDAGYQICTMGGGLPRSENVLSSGYRSLADLCLRMALLDAMYEKEPPCIIMDDPFIHFDDEKYHRTMELLEACSDRYQILYLSCGRRV